MIGDTEQTFYDVAAAGITLGSFIGVLPSIGLVFGTLYFVSKFIWVNVNGFYNWKTSRAAAKRAEVLTESCTACKRDVIIETSKD